MTIEAVGSLLRAARDEISSRFLRSFIFDTGACESAEVSLVDYRGVSKKPFYIPPWTIKRVRAASEIGDIFVLCSVCYRKREIQFWASQGLLGARGSARVGTLNAYRSTRT